MENDKRLKKARRLKRIRLCKQVKNIVGIVLLLAALGLFLLGHYQMIDKVDLSVNLQSFLTTLAFTAGLLCVIPFHLIGQIIYDNREYDKNKTLDELVEKIRYRATLFNNIAIIIFFFTLIVIFSGFYLLVHANDNPKDFTVGLTIRIGVSVLLIFLVQILFKVFKYLLRVAAFYLAKADAIEYHTLNSGSDLKELMELFTPTAYDITDMQQTSTADNLIEVIKAKFGK